MPFAIATPCFTATLAAFSSAESMLNTTFLSERERRLTDLRAEHHAPCGAHGFAIGFLIEGVLLAETDEQHARCADAGDFGHHQGRARAAAHVAGFDHARDQ